MFQILFFAHIESSFLATGLFSWLILSRTLCNNVLTMLEVSSILTDQKLVVQFDSKLTWEMKLLISHGILYLNDYQTTKSCWFARLRFMGKNNVSPLLWWRLYKLSSHFVIDKKNFSSVTVCVEWRSVTQWFPAPKRQLWRKKSIVLKSSWFHHKPRPLGFVHNWSFDEG